MKSILTIILLLNIITSTLAQTTTQLIGNAKLTNAAIDNTATDVVVKSSDGTLAIRKMNTFSSDLSNFPGSKDETIKHDGNNWVANNFLINTGSSIGIGNSNPSFVLDVIGDVRFGKPSQNLGGGKYLHDTKISTNSGYTIFRLLLDHFDASQSGNMFFGSNGPDTNIQGSYGNLGVGGFTLRKLSTGYNNISIGNTSQINTDIGIMNTSIGVSSLFFNKEGSQNVAIGANAGYNSLGDRNVFIGYQAGLNETGSDKLYIQNIVSNTPLLYGEFNNKMLQVNGSLHIEDIIKLKPSSAPSNPVEGTIYYDGTLKKVRVWNGTNWENLN